MTFFESYGRRWERAGDTDSVDDYAVSTATTLLDGFGGNERKGSSGHEVSSSLITPTTTSRTTRTVARALMSGVIPVEIMV